MADIDNQGNGGGGDYADVAMAEEDEMGECCLIGCICMACLGWATLGASGALATLSSHATTTATSAVVQALAGAGVVAGFLGKALGWACCWTAGDMCLYGNTEGIQQQDQPHGHAAVD